MHLWLAIYSSRALAYLLLRVVLESAEALVRRLGLQRPSQVRGRFWLWALEGRRVVVGERARGAEGIFGVLHVRGIHFCGV